MPKTISSPILQGASANMSATTGSNMSQSAGSQISKTQPSEKNVSPSLKGEDSNNTANFAQSRNAQKEKSPSDPMNGMGPGMNMTRHDRTASQREETPQSHGMSRNQAMLRNQETPRNQKTANNQGMPQIPRPINMTAHEAANSREQNKKSPYQDQQHNQKNASPSQPPDQKQNQNSQRQKKTRKKGWWSRLHPIAKATIATGGAVAFWDMFT